MTNFNNCLIYCHLSGQNRIYSTQRVHPDHFRLTSTSHVTLYQQNGRTARGNSLRQIKRDRRFTLIRRRRSYGKRSNRFINTCKSNIGQQSFSSISYCQLACAFSFHFRHKLYFTLHCRNSPYNGNAEQFFRIFNATNASVKHIHTYYDSNGGK